MDALAWSTVVWSASALLALLGVGCQSPSAPVEQTATSAAASGGSRAPAVVAGEQEAHAACERLLARARAEPQLPGTPALDAARPGILGRAKAAAVLFERPPAVSEGPQREAQLYREQLRSSRAPLWQLHLLSKLLVNRPELARAVFLREGYLYAEAPELAGAITEWVELGHLFRAPELRVERGAEVRRVRRGKLYYEWLDGPEQGKRARLWLFDRVWEAEAPPAAPLHLDVGALAARLGFDELRVERITAAHLIAALRYGELEVPTLLSRVGTGLREQCELVPPGASEQLQAARSLHARRAAVLAKLREVIGRKLDEALPFDEPRTEIGQQDGELRRAWAWAYRHGWDSYQFNGDGYRVFDAAGRPLIPEVCIDFITDVLERSSGTWYRSRDEPRERTQGRLDFDALALDNRRSVERFVDYAWSRPDWFEVVDLAPEERVPLMAGRAFFDGVYAHRARFRPLDIVTIHGLRSDGNLHYHSFFIVDADPVSGMPTLVASNAGVPRVRTWEQEMRPAPRRSIKTRIRPRLEWLEELTHSQPSVSLADPPTKAEQAPPI